MLCHSGLTPSGQGLLELTRWCMWHEKGVVVRSEKIMSAISRRSVGSGLNHDWWSQLRRVLCHVPTGWIPEKGVQMMRRLCTTNGGRPAVMTWTLSGGRNWSRKRERRKREISQACVRTESAWMIARVAGVWRGVARRMHLLDRRTACTCHMHAGAPAEPAELIKRLSAITAIR